MNNSSRQKEPPHHQFYTLKKNPNSEKSLSLISNKTLKSEYIRETKVTRIEIQMSAPIVLEQQWHTEMLIILNRLGMFLGKTFVTTF